MKRDNKPIEPDASPRSAKTKKLNMPPKAQNLCGNCAQPIGDVLRTMIGGFGQVCTACEAMITGEDPVDGLPF